jgi:hypothetical protein
MRKSVQIPVIALVAVAVLASPALANPTYSAGYPKTGPTTGGIVVKGTINLSTGTVTTGQAMITAVLVGGGPVKTGGFSVVQNQSGEINWGEAEITGLTSGQTYNITVQITVRTGAVITHMATDTKTATAK